MTNDGNGTGSRPRKIAVLGGGAAALSAVHELTLEPDWRAKYDITVYQLGWRLGGKARSGRNRAKHDRVEEHGLHILIGFYEMTFRLLFDAYDYVEQHGLGCGAPFGGVKQAIRPMPSWQLQERFPGEPREWRHWPVRFATNSLYPGEEGRARPDLFVASFVRAALRWIVRRLGCARARRGSGERDADRPARRSAFSRAALLVAGGCAYPFARVTSLVLGRVQHRVTRASANRTLRRAFYTADLSCALVRGLVENARRLSKPDAEGFHELDDEDFIDWLRRHGLTETSAERSPMLINLYKTIAHNGCSLAAGSALYTVLRVMLTWTGSPQYLMNAGMGDVVVAPVFQMLRHKGVKFEFFHRVTNLRLSADGRSIDAVEMVRQCALKEGVEAYEPLYPVKGNLQRPIDCWPSEPLWEQLEHDVAGVDLRRLEEREGLESFHAIPGERDATIHRARDFDVVLNAIAIGAHASICRELIDADPEYAAFVARGTENAIHPIGGQIWLTADRDELGWGRTMPDFRGRDPGRTLCGTYLDPVNGYTDMSHVLVAEGFGGGTGAPRSLAYFWGVRPDIPERYWKDGEPDQHESLADYLEDHMEHFWPAAYEDGAFQWDRVVYGDPTNGGHTGRERIRDQYVPSIPSGSDLYNRAPRDSTRGRLRAGALFERWGLVLAGDYMRTRFNIALVEGAVESGIRAANVIRGKPEPYRTIG